ncbi:MAG: aminopeptidase P family protein [Candidatus Omnitrophica bacterium]|nr:aminopeptidase P family protein [Candidatus Omnitrophota bacterium]MDD5591735.1 aminopeptidase P family protein [Candidatus Omnitrophota bacterium]
MNLRIKYIYTKLKEKNLDALLVFSPANISYLTDFTSRDSHLLISRQKNIYITDSRYIQEARACLKNIATVKQADGPIMRIIPRLCQDLGLKRIGFEERRSPLAEDREDKIKLNKKYEFIPTHGLIEGLRQVKDKEEIKKIKTAIQITVKAFEFIRNFISAGKREIEIAAEIERFVRYRGAQGCAFEIIVAAGANSSLPHHRTSQRKIKNNEHVLVDIGVEYAGYKSDLTRIFFLGKITPTVRKVYDIVRRAQDKAIEKIKPAVPISGIDTAARQYITRKGYGGFFGHALGHGIGLEVHEKPSISSKEKGILNPGMVFTVEPAIYLPHRFGIRLEDIVLVTKKGCEVLSGPLDK